MQNFVLLLFICLLKYFTKLVKIQNDKVIKPRENEDNIIL